MKELEGMSSEVLYSMLQDVDPVAAKDIHPNNVQRVIRAIERHELTGKQRDEIEQNQGKEKVFPHYIIGLTIDREILYQRINKRVDLMIEQGLLQEVKGLYDKGIRDVQSIQAIGYKEIYAYLDGNSTLEDAVETLKQNSRRYAKRQLTYFRNKMDIQWFDPFNDRESILEEISRFLQENQ